jgi:CheY-like chemotaxis protein
MATLLVIDDEAPIRENLVRFLTLEGHQVVQAADGLGGLEAMRAHLPALVFCDVMMPRLDGFGVLAAMQSDPTLKPIPLVFLSASAEPERLEQGLLLGARRYVTKPFNLARLHQLLQELLPPGAAHG